MRQRIARHAQHGRAPAIAPSVAGRGVAASSISQILSTRSFPRPSVSRSCRCSQRYCSQRSSHAPPETTTSSHWPSSDSAATGAPFESRPAAVAPESAAAARSARCSWCGLGADHEIGEVRSDHRRRADQQHDQHLQPPAGGAARRVVGARRRGHRVHRQLSGCAQASEAAGAGADELEPDIQDQPSTHHRVPLDRVAVLLVDIDRRMRATARSRPSRGGGRIVLLHRHRRERQTDLGANTRRGRDFAGSAPALRRRELVEPGRRRGDQPIAPRPFPPASRPAAATCGRAMLRGAQPRCTSTAVARPSSRSGVTTKKPAGRSSAGCRGTPCAPATHCPRTTAGAIVLRVGALRRRARDPRCAAAAGSPRVSSARLQRDLLGGAVELPDAQRAGDGRRPPPSPASPCSQRRSAVALIGATPERDNRLA